MQNQCPKCGAPRANEHQFCPSCGYDYRQVERPAPSVPKQSAGDRRRDFIVLGLVAVATALIYNVIAASVTKDRPELPKTTAAAPLLQNVVQEGHRFMDAGQFDQAIPQYERALSIDSLQPDIMVDLGACYHAIGENDKADFQFRRALVINPKHPVALFNLGVVSLTVGDTASAKSWWTKYLDVATDPEQTQMVREQLSKM